MVFKVHYDSAVKLPLRAHRSSGEHNPIQGADKTTLMEGGTGNRAGCLPSKYFHLSSVKNTPSGLI